MEASITSSRFDLLPLEKQMEIFSLLPLKDVVIGTMVCRQWDGLLKDPIIWKRFFVQLVPSKQRDSELKPEDFFSAVVKKIKKLTLDLKKGQLLKMTAICRLNRISCNFDASSAYEIIKGLLAGKLSRESTLDAKRILKYYKHDLEKVKELIPFFGNTTFRVLSRVVWKAINENKIDEVMSLLDMSLLDDCKNFSFWGPCIVDLARLFDEKGEQEKCQQLKLRFPEQLETTNNTRYTGHYYTFTNRLDITECLAVEFTSSKNYHKAIDVLEVLRNEYQRQNNEEEAQRIQRSIDDIRERINFRKNSLW